MIQRIQSLYLAVAVAAYVSLFFFPFASFTASSRFFQISVLGVMENGALNQRAVPMLAGIVLLIILTTTIIFLFKKRMLQSRLTAISLLLNVGLIAGMFFYSDSVSNKSASFDTGAYLAVIPIIFLILANRAIRKDELKVRAADRLR